MLFGLCALLSFVGVSLGSSRHGGRLLGLMPSEDACLCQTTEIVYIIGTPTPEAEQTPTETLDTPSATTAPVDAVDYMKPCPNPTIDKSAPANLVPASNVAVYYESADGSSGVPNSFLEPANMMSPVGKEMGIAVTS
jgi:hypothetical protein